MNALQLTSRKQARRLRRAPRVTVVGVIGEVFITAGVLVLLFLGWQVWLNDIIVGAQQREAADELAQEWERPPVTPVTPQPNETREAEPTEPVGIDNPAVLAAPAENTKFANLIVPRLGADYRRPITEGVGYNVLNDSKAGIGHYPQTQMPGDFGNFAMAAHRTTYGRSFHNVNEFVVGDSMYVETELGWYRYVYRNTEYVRPTGVGVLNAVPQTQGIDANERFITLTSCNPYFSSAERIISYGVFDVFFPREGGAPLEIAELVQATGA